MIHSFRILEMLCTATVTEPATPCTSLVRGGAPKQAIRRRSATAGIFTSSTAHAAQPLPLPATALPHRHCLCLLSPAATAHGKDARQVARAARLLRTSPISHPLR